MSLNKELGIPGVKDEDGRTVSLNFYYGHILKMCHDHLNRLKMKEATNDAMISIFGEVVEQNKKESNVYERFDDSYIVSSFISTLGEHFRERIDHNYVYGFSTMICWNIIKEDMSSLRKSF
jgi:hypothetical protein